MKIISIIVFFAIVTAVISCKSDFSESVSADSNMSNPSIKADSLTKLKNNNIYMDYYESGELRLYLYYGDSLKDCWTQGVFFRKNGMIKEIYLNQNCFYEQDSSSEFYGSMIYESDYLILDSSGQIIEHYFVDSSQSVVETLDY